MLLLIPRRTHCLYKILRPTNHFDQSRGTLAIPTVKRVVGYHQVCRYYNTQICKISCLASVRQNTISKLDTRQPGVTAMASQTSRSAVVRYSPGEERFQLKLIHNKKVFNFDRATSDSLEALISRIVANMSKKMKSWDGVVSLLTSRNGSWTEIVDKSIPVSKLLQDIHLEGSFNKLSIKISEERYDVVFNPPEVFSIKFLKGAIVGFPIVPYKIDTSSNFDKHASKYHWEYSWDQKKEPNVVKKKNRQTNPNNSTTSDDDCSWKDTGCSECIFTPGVELIGARLRLTFLPSDGACFGLPFTEEIPELVTALPVEKPLLVERLERILKHGPTEEQRKETNFLRIVSYNCLAECYATEEWFTSSPKASLPAEFRLPFLCKELLSYQSDVYCLQEVDDKYFDRLFTPFLEHTLGCKGFFSCKTGSVKEGVAMFYNPKKLDCMKSETVVINEHLKTMPIWSKLMEQSSIVERVDERNSVLQVSIFKAKAQENTIIIIANTHLYFHPDADHIRLLQTIACVDYIETVSSEIKKFGEFKVCVMFCGDFNCTPPFSSFRYLTTGKIDDDDLDWTSHSTQKLQPGISLQHNLELTNSDPEHALSNITTCFEGCIDYILFQSQHFNLISAYPPPDKTTLADLCNVSETRLVSLPNFYTPSDHLPLIADFQLRSKQ